MSAPNTGTAQSALLDAAIHAVWLHGGWRWLTLNMTTEQREAAADAVQRHNDALAVADGDTPAELRDLRWWRQ